MRLEPKTIVSDRYEIIELIGVGGMANVYCAMDLKLDRKVSFKVLKEEFIDEEFIGRFSKEARAAARISHVNIANVYDVGNDGNIYYIVMEYVDGYTLKDVIKTKAPFENDEVLGISIQIANALEIAHQNNIVHRDIKPQNILVTKEGGVKVTDFGIARATTSNTITTDTMGSVHYFSPEQARGGYVDFKSDIYSLGIIMFEMTTGSLPFDGDGVVQLAMKHINEPLPNIKEINPKISDSLEKIILKATEKNADNRYSSAKEFNNDLKKALSNTTGDFIKTNTVDEDSPTVVIKPEEIEQIKNMAKNKETMDKEKINNDKINTNKPKDKYKDEEYVKKETSKNKKIVPNTANVNNKSIEKKVTLWAVITSLILISIISIFLVFWLKSSDMSKVPSFVDKTWDQALELAKNKELYITNIEEKYDDNIAEGHIIDQDIKAGKKVKKGSNINISLSLGNGQFEVENFVGLDISSVYKKVENYEVNLKEEYIYDEKVDIGKVIKQIPEAGKKLKPKDDLTLYISKGSENNTQTVTVPYLIGLSEEDAKAKIKKEGLSLGKISKVNSDTVKKGDVIEQTIPYGNEVAEKTPISIVVSNGKKEETTKATTETTAPIVEDSSTENTSQVIEQTETTTAPALKSEVLVIDPKLPEGTESVEVKVVKILDGTSSVILSSNHKVDSFPLSITVIGDKPTQFELYIDGKLIATETKNFN